MNIYWKIEEAHKDSQRVERFHFCDTSAIQDPNARFPLELIAELHTVLQRRILSFRAYFAPSTRDHYLGHGSSELLRLIVVGDYFEDESQQPLTRGEWMHRLFGVPIDALMVPGSHSSHDITLSVALAQRESLFEPIDRPPTDEDKQLLRTFVQEVNQLAACRFLKQQSPFGLEFVGPDGTGTLRMIPIEQITHFVITLRRLTAQREPANVLRICNLLFKIAPDAPAVKWIGGERSEYVSKLSERASNSVFNRRELPFTNDVLFTLFLNSDFAHPGTPEDERRKNEMAVASGGPATLKYVFLSLAQSLALYVLNIGNLVDRFLRAFEPRSACSNANFKSSASPFPREELLNGRDRRDFEETVTRFADNLRARDGTRSLHEHLESARLKLRDCL